MHERIRSRLRETEDDVRAIGIAVAEHTEWRRIGYVMEEEGLDVYDAAREREQGDLQGDRNGQR